MGRGWAEGRAEPVSGWAVVGSWPDWRGACSDYLLLSGQSTSAAGWTADSAAEAEAELAEAGG